MWSSDSDDDDEEEEEEEGDYDNDDSKPYGDNCGDDCAHHEYCHDHSHVVVMVVE